MTEYGRGRTPEPWHPEDPLYGDQGWTGHPVQQGQTPYAGGAQEQYQQPPQHPDPQTHQPPYADPQYRQQYPPQQYQDPQYPDPQYPSQQQYPGQQQYPDPQQGHAPQQRPAPQQGGPQSDPQQPAYGDQGWDTGQGQYVAGPAPVDPYAGVDPYVQQNTGAYPGEAPDPYSTPDAYPPPQPPGRRHLEPEPGAQAQDGDLLTEEREEEDGSLAGGDPDGSGGGRRSGRSKDTTKRSGAACLIAALVIVGVVGGGGYYGYTYLKSKFSSAADFAGTGTDESVDVEIPKNAGLMLMGQLLKKAGVVASAEAFAAAAEANPKGKSIQPGVYSLKKEMSARSAVEVMIDPAALNVLTIPEGKRNFEIYNMVDKKLSLKPGTTKDVAAKEAKNLGLPDWANSNKNIKDPLEGFLYPARYDLGKDMKPEALLKQMVAKASQEYANADVKGQATKMGLKNPLELVTVASLVQAEGKYQHDFDKISRVVYNRLKPGNTETNGLLDFDSTINYIKGQSTLDVGSVKELRQIADPYNTYKIVGLPAGPISNPGADALKAATNPEPGPWYYFVSVNENKTLFAVTNDEHNVNVEEYERERKKSGQ
ncbi:endolytic transglycosylase MltG [Streptomyces sp. NPDC051000]|uniref:endolytic transglycosylase MltG n=1 Tax=Streptomyces sp. NPDC051000 TaxID=3155520 RepID=UPI0033DB0D06